MKISVSRKILVILMGISLIGAALVFLNAGVQDPNEAIEPEFADIATLYNYGNGVVRIHAWINNEAGSFDYSGPRGWFGTTRGYDGTKIYHPVAGDWNGDGLTDMAAFYDYGDNAARIHVWINDNGERVEYQGPAGWWAVKSGYDLTNIVDAVSGDLNGDNLDDIAVFYNYGESQIRIHVWLSTGDRFLYEGPKGWWAVTGYPYENIIGAVAGEFSR
jgi:hypothetical protein